MDPIRRISHAGGRFIGGYADFRAAAVCQRPRRAKIPQYLAIHGYRHSQKTDGMDGLFNQIWESFALFPPCRRCLASVSKERGRVPPRPARLTCDTRAAVKRRLSVFIMRSAPRTLKSAILSLFTAIRVAIHRQLKPALKYNPAQTYQRRHTLQ